MMGFPILTKKYSFEKNTDFSQNCGKHADLLSKCSHDFSQCRCGSGNEGCKPGILLLG